MFCMILNFMRVVEIRRKIFFILVMLIVFWIGMFILVFYINVEVLKV